MRENQLLRRRYSKKHNFSSDLGDLQFIFHTQQHFDEIKQCDIIYKSTYVYTAQTFLQLTPLSHNLNNTDILIQNQTPPLINMDKTYPGCFGILSIEFFLTFN